MVSDALFACGITLPVVSLVLFGLGMYIYFSIWKSKKIYHYLHTIFPRRTALMVHTVIQKCTMFIAFGLLPLVVITRIFHLEPADFGLRFSLPQKSIHPLLLIGIGIGCWCNPGARKDSWPYPQMRVREWTAGLVLLNALLWAVYLIAYEFMFRGFLFYSFLRFGYWTATLVSTSLYSAMHGWKGLFETIGSVPLGLLLCLLTFRSGTILPAFLLHYVMALLTSIASIRKKEGLCFTGRQKAS